MTAANVSGSQFASPIRSLADPCANAVAVTPSDTDDLDVVPSYLYIGSGGNLTVNMKDSGSQILFVAVPTGTLLPIRVSRVFSNGTGADDIVALW